MCKKEQTTKYFLKTAEVLLDKFDVYQCKVALNCFKCHTNSWCPDIFQKKYLYDVQSEIHLVWRNIVSSRQSVPALKKIIFRLAIYDGTEAITLEIQNVATKGFYFP